MTAPLPQGPVPRNKTYVPSNCALHSEEYLKQFETQADTPWGKLPHLTPRRVDNRETYPGVLAYKWWQGPGDWFQGSFATNPQALLEALNVTENSNDWHEEGP